MAFKLDSKIPAGELSQKWSNHKAAIKVVSPANKRKLDIIVVGTGLGGASAAASLGELGYNVKVFCIQDSPRRAHSIAAQGGINAAKNYQNDNDSVYRLFYDTIKGGDYRAREANVYRLAEVSNLIIDQCVAQGVPFAREYGGLLANRSFGGAQVSRTFYARGQTGQQLLLGTAQKFFRYPPLANAPPSRALPLAHAPTIFLRTKDVRAPRRRTFYNLALGALAALYSTSRGRRNFPYRAKYIAAVLPFRGVWLCASVSAFCKAK